MLAKLINYICTPSPNTYTKRNQQFRDGFFSLRRKNPLFRNCVIYIYIYARENSKWLLIIKKMNGKREKRWHCSYWIFICYIKHTNECSINKCRMNMYIYIYIYVPTCNEREDQLSVITDLLHKIQGFIHLLWGQSISILVWYWIWKKSEMKRHNPEFVYVNLHGTNSLK